MPDSTWVLDLSSNPPNIYNSAGTEDLHNALESPYPVCFWYVSTNPNDVTHMGELQYHSPCMEQPYPYVFWFINSTGDDIVHNAEQPYEEMGAFRKSNLGQVKITPTTKLLGSYSFAQTFLSEVTIANDCVYYPTTFPDTCEVSFYEEV